MALLTFYIGFDWVPRYCGYGGCSDQYAYWWQVFFLGFGAILTGLGLLTFKRH